MLVDLDELKPPKVQVVGITYFERNMPALYVNLEPWEKERLYDFFQYELCDPDGECQQDATYDYLTPMPDMLEKTYILRMRSCVFDDIKTDVSNEYCGPWSGRQQFQAKYSGQADAKLSELIRNRLALKKEKQELAALYIKQTRKFVERAASLNYELGSWQQQSYVAAQSLVFLRPRHLA